MGWQSIAGHHTLTYTKSFKPRGNLYWPFHLPAHFGELGGNQRTRTKPTETWRATCAQTRIQAQDKSGDSGGVTRH